MYKVHNYEKEKSEIQKFLNYLSPPNKFYDVKSEKFDGGRSVAKNYQQYLEEEPYLREQFIRDVTDLKSQLDAASAEEKPDPVDIYGLSWTGGDFGTTQREYYNTLISSRD